MELHIISLQNKSLNTKSSTEAELVGASYYIAYTVWMKRFMDEQGYKIDSNIFYQDNESAMKMEKNGRDSAENRSRHINMRYFFIKDLLQREESLCNIVQLKGW